MLFPRSRTLTRYVGGDFDSAEIQSRALVNQVNLRYFDNGDIGIALDETVSPMI